MTTLGWLLHELLSRHGSSTLEIPAGDRSREHGGVIECPCGKRWLGHAPWFLGGDS